MIPQTIAALGIYYFMDRNLVRMEYVVPIAAGAVAGAFIGTKLVKIISSRKIARMFSVLLIIICIKLISDSFFDHETKLTLTYIPARLFLGILAGICSSLFGIGGGMIIVPALTLLMGLPMQQAIVTSLAIVLPTTITGAILHKKLDNIDFSIVKYLVPAALCGAYIGAVTAYNLPGGVLKTIFGIYLLWSAIELYKYEK